MNPTTFNIIAGAALTTMGGVLIFMLGVMNSYIRNINHTLKDMYGMNIEHKTKIEHHDEQIKDIYEKVYKLNKAS